MGYVEQTDIHSPYLTVFETLLFSCNLRMTAEVSTEDKKMYVEKVIELLRLDSVSGLLVGEGSSGISPNQAKRLSIGVEMTSNPSIMFLDEPT